MIAYMNMFGDNFCIILREIIINELRLFNN
jgi:hypothetical protein